MIERRSHQANVEYQVQQVMDARGVDRETAIAMTSCATCGKYLGITARSVRQECQSCMKARRSLRS